MKKFSVVILGVILVMLLSGCRIVVNRGEKVDGKASEKVSFSDGVFLKYTHAPAGEILIYESFDTHVEVSSDGSVRIYCDDFPETFMGEYPTRTMQLSEEDIAALKEAILENDILSLREDISTESLDGDYFYLTVYTENGEHRTGGLNPTNRRFLAVKDLISEMTEEECHDLRDEISAIQEQGYIERYNLDE